MARKILLADDSVTAQNMGRKILADAGYEVITVNNGSAALKKIAELKKIYGLTLTAADSHKLIEEPARRRPAKGKTS